MAGKTKHNFAVQWTIHGATLVRATDEIDAQHRFDEMSVQRLFNPRQTSPYGHPDSVWDYRQNTNPAPHEGSLQNDPTLTKPWPNQASRPAPPVDAIEVIEAEIALLDAKATKWNNALTAAHNRREPAIAECNRMIKAQEQAALLRKVLARINPV